ncbi:hypothetical protein RF11_08872 [Thelohanellus kitauei]|uniref:Uncharacterized protein n=1 Tax=Thelohanellus kitauei TaxID=669202 RepID=A0A0C2MYF5_THEKT|nr:hypothetical protein RF11_08872 [Thelohanellus kitauei]
MPINSALLTPVPTTWVLESKQRHRLDQALDFLGSSATWISQGDPDAFNFPPAALQTSDPVRRLPVQSWTSQVGLDTQGGHGSVGLLFTSNLWALHLFTWRLLPFASLASTEQLAFHWLGKPDEHLVQYYLQDSCGPDLVSQPHASQLKPQLTGCSSQPVRKRQARAPIVRLQVLVDASRMQRQHL